MSERPKTRAERIEVVYNGDHWRLLNDLRSQALRIMNSLKAHEVESIIYGSIARGDVSPKSDIDIFIPNPPSSFLVEVALERAGIPISQRVLIQATPSYVAKAYIEIDERRSVSFPLMRLRRVERGFYRFSGELPLQRLRSGERVCGVDKRLMLIEPTARGHVESGITGREGYVAGLLGVDVEVVSDRVRTLLRRDEVGRTGVYLKRALSACESFEAVLKEIIDRSPAMRRRIRTTERRV
ncbi:MAG: nucleotidyltransferase domain-containing protein [Candidatus Bathyarchaeia archaeon]